MFTYKPRFFSYSIIFFIRPKYNLNLKRWNIFDVFFPALIPTRILERPFTSPLSDIKDFAFIKMHVPQYMPPEGTAIEPPKGMLICSMSL